MPLLGDLKGRRAVVTGGATGIGRATVRALAEQGVRIAVADIGEAGARETLRGMTVELEAA